jgi:hypothetical protein
MKRTRIILIAAVLLLVTLGASAFDLTVGIKGGAGFPFFGGSDYTALLSAGTQTKFRFGFSVGAFVSLGIIDFLAIQPEVMYSSLGGNFGASGTWYDTANAIEVPLLLKVRLKYGSMRISPFVGADALFRLGDWTYEIKDSSGAVLVPKTAYDPQNIRVPIFGLAFGVGFEFPIGGGWLSLEARGLLGLQNRYTDNNTYGFKDWRQNNISVLLGYGFDVIR